MIECLYHSTLHEICRYKRVFQQTIRIYFFNSSVLFRLLHHYGTLPINTVPLISVGSPNAIQFTFRVSKWYVGILKVITFKQVVARIQTLGISRYAMFTSSVHATKTILVRDCLVSPTCDNVLDHYISGRVELEQNNVPTEVCNIRT